MPDKYTVDFRELRSARIDGGALGVDFKENDMEDDLKEALEAIKDLRAALQLARHDPAGFTDADEVKMMAETDALLRKHGETDDLMDSKGE